MNQQTTSEQVNPYAIFQVKRQTLVDMIDRIQKTCEDLEQTTLQEALRALRDKVQSNEFKLMVVGNFKSGKSTFINALLSENVLPTDPVPCTAVINEVKWGTERKAMLYFRHPLPKVLPKLVSKKSLQYINQYAGGDRPLPPMPIPVDEISEFLVIPDPAQSQAKSVGETPYDRVEMFWPLPLCKNGVEIIDSPGINEDTSREKITIDYLAKVDAVLFVMTSLQQASKSELDFVNYNIRPCGHEDVFFIFNRFDQLNGERDQQRVVAYGREKLASLTNLGEQGIFFLSAWQALEGRVNNDAALVERSRINPLERSLTEFLVNQRGKIKLLQPTRELNFALRSLRADVIPGQRALLATTLDDVEKKTREIEPKLVLARRSKEQLVQQMRNHFALLIRDVQDEARPFLTELADLIPGLVESMETESKIHLIGFKHKEEAEAVVHEVLEKLNSQLGGRFAEWQKQTLDPLFKKGMDDLAVRMKGSIELFYEQLGDIQADFTGGEKIELPKGTQASGVERFLASVTGLLVGDVFSAFHGANFGWGGLLASIAVQITLISGMIVLGIANPIAWLAVLASGGCITALIRTGSITAKLKSKLAKDIGAGFKSSIPETIGKITNKITELTNKIIAAAEKTLDREIQSIDDQLRAALDIKRAGEESVREKQALLTRAEAEINAVDAQLKELILDLAETSR